MSDKPNIVAIIPARGGSKGIPKKNLLILSGKPLIAWSIQQALASRFIDEVYVSSDSDEILAVSASYGAKSIKRPDHLATDTATSESALQHALEVLETEQRQPLDYIVFLQATSPLRTDTDIDSAIETLIANDGDSLLSCCRLGVFFIWEYQNDAPVGVNHDYKHRRRRQDLKSQYLENGSIYVFKPEILKQHDNRLGGQICLYEMPQWQSVEIDVIEDKELCEWYMQTKLLPQQQRIPATDSTGA
jgi:CMP-N,N'-diacetyllegionaminic acid synthase